MDLVDADLVVFARVELLVNLLFVGKKALPILRLLLLNLLLVISQFHDLLLAFSFLLRKTGKFKVKFLLLFFKLGHLLTVLVFLPVSELLLH